MYSFKFRHLMSGEQFRKTSLLTITFYLKHSRIRLTILYFGSVLGSDKLKVEGIQSAVKQEYIPQPVKLLVDKLYVHRTNIFELSKYNYFLFTGMIQHHQELKHCLNLPLEL